MELFILRHAIAVERGTAGYERDFDRPLTPDGEQKLRRIAKAMQRLELSFDLILSSPYVRARETAEVVAATLTLRTKIQLQDSLGADGNPGEFITELIALKPSPKDVLLVGHEPFLSTLISILVSGTATPCVTLKKAGLCKMTIDALRAGRCGKLDWLLTPKQMLLMG